MGIFPLLRPSITFQNYFFQSAIIEQNNLDPNLRNSKSISVLKDKIHNFIRPSPNYSFDCHNPKWIKLITILRLVLSHLRQHKFKHSFKAEEILYVTVVKILSPRLIFSSTVPSLIIKGALPSALYIAVIVNCWIVPIMIPHKCYSLATHPKFHVITSKSLTYRSILFYWVRDSTNHFLKKIL